MLRYILLLLLAVNITPWKSLRKADPCKFAREYDGSQFLSDTELVEQFFRDFARYEAKFIQAVGVDQNTGLTLDGIRVDVKTGELLPQTLHRFTASSKQSIHLGILAKVLQDAPYAYFVYQVRDVFTIVQRKVNTLQKFYEKYPGYGGFLPWINVNGTLPSPTSDFINKVPALDNGQMFWGALALSSIWQQNYPNVLPQLRRRFDNVYWKLMIKNVRKMFFNETTKKIRAVADIKDMYLDVANNTYLNTQDYYLDDPYEGEMFLWIVTLFAKDQFTKQEIQFLWQDKRNKLQSTDYKVLSRNKDRITVQKGWVFSSHEQWKNLFLPYYLSPTYKRIQINNQRARVWHSIDIEIPGMYAAMAGPADDNSQDTGYFNAGIQEISFQKVQFYDLVPPYGAFPLLLVNKQYGAAWLHNTIYSPGGQTKYGALEGTGLNGSLISPTLTWDTKITTLLAVMNGTTAIINDYLQNNGLLSQFVNRIQKEYALAFPVIRGQDIPLALPSVQIKKGRPDFTSCN